MKSNIVNLQGTWQQMRGVGKQLENMGFQTHEVNRGKIRRIHAPNDPTTTAIITLLSNTQPALILSTIDAALPIVARLCVIEFENNKQDIVVIPLHQKAEIRLLMAEEMDRTTHSTNRPSNLAELELDGSASEELRQDLAANALLRKRPYRS